METLQTYEFDGGALRIKAPDGPVSTSLGAGTGTARAVAAPGAGSFKFGELQVEQEADTLALSVKVSGPHLAYLYAELLLKDPQADRFYGPVLREYIRAERNESTSGILRPHWGESVDVRAHLRPVRRLVTNGADSAFCFALPEGYSSSGYRLGGTYTLAGEKQPYRALLGFSADGALNRALAYSDQVKLSGPQVLTPAEGDSFVPFVQVFTPGAQKGTWEVTPAVADTLVLGAYPLRVVSERPLPGDYLVGVLAQDFDGGLFREYVALRLG